MVHDAAQPQGLDAIVEDDLLEHLDPWCHAEDAKRCVPRHDDRNSG